MCKCERIPQIIACVKCGYPPSESLHDLGPEHDDDCKRKECGEEHGIR